MQRHSVRGGASGESKPARDGDGHPRPQRSPPQLFEHPHRGRWCPSPCRQSQHLLRLRRIGEAAKRISLICAIFSQPLFQKKVPTERWVCRSSSRHPRCGKCQAALGSIHRWLRRTCLKTGQAHADPPIIPRILGPQARKSVISDILLVCPRFTSHLPSTPAPQSTPSPPPIATPAA